MSTTDTSFPHLCYSQLLNSHFNPHCHLPAGMEFVYITALCSKNGYVPLHLSFALSLPIHAFGWIYNRIPKLTYSSYPQTEVHFNSKSKSKNQRYKIPHFFLTEIFLLHMTQRAQAESKSSNTRKHGNLN